MSVDGFNSVVLVLWVFTGIFIRLFQCKNEWNDVKCIKPAAGVLASAQMSVELNDVNLRTFLHPRVWSGSFCLNQNGSFSRTSCVSFLSLHHH